MFYQILFSQHVKRSPVISNKQPIYELLHELPNNLRLRMLQNYESSKKSQTFIDYNLVSSSPPKMKILLMLEKTCRKIKIKCFPYFVISHEN